MTASPSQAEVAQIAREIIAQVEAGKIDLRPVGHALTGKWDQDIPRALLDAAADTAKLQRELAEAREIVSRFFRSMTNDDSNSDTILSIHHEALREVVRRARSYLDRTS